MRTVVEKRGIHVGKEERRPEETLTTKVDEKMRYERRNERDKPLKSTPCIHTEEPLIEASSDCQKHDTIVPVIVLYVTRSYPRL